MHDQDADQGYPFHQHRRPRRRAGNGYRSPIDEQYDQDDTVLSAAELPPDRTKKALLIGLVAGLLCVAQSIIITLVNASTYHAFDTARDQAVKNALAFTIFGYAMLTFFITLLLLLIAGFITGKIAVQRRSGFLSGFVAGLIIYGASFIINYIPGYPGNQHTSSTGPTDTGIVLGGIIIILVFFLVWGVIGGLMSLLGAWIATRRHPYYVE